MISVDGKKLDLSVKDDPKVKFFNECMNALENKCGERISIEYTNAHIKRVDNRMQRAPQLSIWLSETINRDGVNEKWTYYENEELNDGKVIRYLPNRFIFNGNKTWDLNTEAKDLPFFLIFISPNCEIISELKGLQNQKPLALKRITITTRIVIDKDTAALNKKKALLYNILYNDLPDEVIKTIAFEPPYSIADSNRIAVLQLRNILYQKITSDEKALKNFDASKYNSEIMMVKSVIHDMIVRNLLDFNNKRKYWQYKLASGEWDDNGDVLFISTAKKNIEEKDKRLFEYCLEHPEIVTTFKAKIKNIEVSVEQ
jgi:hypothetical protein